MSVLSDNEIRGLIKDGILKIDPFDERLVSPASYDLRVGKKALRTTKDRGSPIVDVEKEQLVEINTGEFIEVMSREKLTLPEALCGRIGLRSYYSRKGVILFSGLQIDPGFDGYLIVSLFNTGPRPVILKYEDPFCTVEFNRLSQPAQKGYSGAYQHQTSFPSDNIEFIIGARGVTLYEVVETMKGLRSDMNWVKVLLALILAALLAALFTKLI